MWTCSWGSAVVLRTIAPGKDQRGDCDGWALQSSTLPLICFTGIHRTEWRCRQRDGRSRVHPPLNAGHAALRAPLLPRGTEQGWLQQRHLWAAPWPGGTLGSVHWSSWTGWHWGGRLLSQHQGFGVFVLLISKICPDLKGFSGLQKSSLQLTVQSVILYYIMHYSRRLSCLWFHSTVDFLA